MTVDKAKFDDVLKRLIQSPPETLKDVVSKPKLKKDGTPKRGKIVQKVDAE